MDNKESKENGNKRHYNIKWERIQDIPTQHDLQKFKDAIDSKQFWHAYFTMSATKIWNHKWYTYNGWIKNNGDFIRPAVYVLGATISAVWQHVKTSNETERELRQKYSKLLEEYTEMKDDLKNEINKWETLTCTCMVEEQTFRNNFKNNEFGFERWNDRKVILMIGPTGFGKSTVCNRLMGNNDIIYKISKSITCPFKTAKNGKIEPETASLNKKSWNVTIFKDNNNKNILGEYELSIIDTPGAFDTKDNDKCFNDTMKNYFNACGGINIFFIFFKYNGKMDKNYIKLLKWYQKFWGKNMWEHCRIIITNCDKDSESAKMILADGLPDTKRDVKAYLNKISGNRCNNIEMYEFGEANFKESRQDILLSLLSHNKKYINKKVSTKINTLWDDQKKQQTKCEELAKKAKIAKDKLNAYQRECTNAEG